MDCSNCRMALIYAHGKKILDIIGFSPIGLLPGVSLTWSCYKMVEEQI